MKASILTLIFGASFAWAATVNVSSEPSQGKIEFEAVGRPSMVKIKGEGEGPSSSLSVKDKKLSGELKFKLQSLKTGIDLRDDHMKNKYLEIDKYPNATLKIQDLALPDNWNEKNPSLKDFPFKGILNLHGKEKEVAGILSMNEQAKAQADFEIKISDFGVEIPSYLGITVADKVKVRLAETKFEIKTTK